MHARCHVQKTLRSSCMSARGEVGLRDYQHADAKGEVAGDSLAHSADRPRPVPPEQASSRYVWYVISLLFLANVLNYMDRMALSVLLPSIKVDLHLSDTELG